MYSVFLVHPYKSYLCCTTNLSMIFTESSEATHYIGVVGRMSYRPVATPEMYSGHFDEWTDHFESVAVPNEWKDTQMHGSVACRSSGRVHTYGIQEATPRHTEELRYS